MSISNTKALTNFIAIEGADGTGKATQANLLAEHVESVLKKPVLKLSFPQYGEDSARFAEQYLNGDYGMDIAPDLASLPYAIDRFAARGKIEEFVNKNPDGIVITDRYVASNLAHQGGKISDTNERHAFYKKILNLEFGILMIPRPSKSFVMLLPEAIAQQNVDKKSVRIYTDKKRDIHEADINHLHNATMCYRELCEIYPHEFIPIDCYNEVEGKMRSVDEIQLLLQAKIAKIVGC